MSVKKILMIFFISFLSYNSFGQKWVMEVSYGGGPNACLWYGYYNISGSFGNAGSSTTYPGGSFKAYSSDGIFKGTIFVSGSYRCECIRPDGKPAENCSTSYSSGSGSLSVNYSQSDGNCIHGNKSFPGETAFSYINYSIYKLLETPVATPSNGSCSDGAIQLYTSGVATSYSWTVTDDPTKDHWYTISNKTTQTINVTAEELDPYHTFVGTKRYVRVSDSYCSGRMSDPSNSFDSYLPPPSQATIEWNEPKCNKGNDGSIVINSIVGLSSSYSMTLSYKDSMTNIFFPVFQSTDAIVLPYKIDKEKVSNAGVLNGISKGVYKVSIANNTQGSCSTEFIYTLSEPTEVSFSVAEQSHINCHGDSNGSVKVNVSGGIGGYSYLWSNGNTQDVLQDLPAGTYSVIVKDANECYANHAKSITLIDPAVLTVDVSVGMPLACAESKNGILASIANGGTPPYKYLWSSSEVGNLAHNLGKGSYSVTVNDNHNCSASKNFIIDAPPPMQVQAVPVSYYDGFNLKCNKSNDGIAKVNVLANGTAPYTFKWSNGDMEQEVFNLTANTYSVTVVDSKKCIAAAKLSLTEPLPIIAKIFSVSDFNGSPISCNGSKDGELSVDVLNAIDPIAYSWSNGESKKTVSNISSGQYSLSLTDKRGCSASAAYDLLEPQKINPTIQVLSNYNGQAISCTDGRDAVIKGAASGGIGLYSFSWTNGGFTPTISNIGAGDYSVKVTDANGCVGTQTINIPNPEPVEALITQVSDYSGFGISCKGLHDGSITAGGAGGTGVYSYVWSDGKTSNINSLLGEGSYSVVVSDNNGCNQSISQDVTSPSALLVTVADAKDIACFGGNDGVITLQSTGGANGYSYSKDNGTNWQSSSIFNSLTVGSYALSVKDDNNCKAQTSSILVQPTKINISFANIQPAFCNNPAGTATSLVTGGVTDYTYEWKDAQLKSVGSTAILQKAKGGIYTLTVHDAHLCEAIKNVAITSTDGAKSSYTSTPAKCFDSSDGSALITITEGDGPFITQWPDGQTTLDGHSLAKGLYDVVITDGHNCSVIQSVEVNAPDALQVYKKQEVIPSCFGSCNGIVELNATGGMGGYTYQWNNQNLAFQSQLCAGTYPIVVKDNNDCTLLETIELQQPEPISIDAVNETQATCKDGCDGALEIIATGGNGNYQYTWIGGNSVIKNDLCPGTYNVSVVDAKGCPGHGTVTLNNTPSVPIDLGSGVTLCVGQSYTLDAGTNWKTVRWTSSTGMSSVDEKITIKEPGSYWLQVLNDKGCVGQDTFLLETSYDLLKASFLIPDEAAVGDTVAMIDISWPLPETVEWVYPDEMDKVLDLGDVMFGQFNETGTYHVSLTTHLGECVDQIEKTIIILERDDQLAGGRLGYEDYVKTFMLHPNPNDGLFEVNVELLEKGDITLSIWNGPTGALIKQIYATGNDNFKIPVDVRPLSSGVYVLRLDHPKGKEYLRFVVQ